MMLNKPHPDDGTVDGWPWWSQLRTIGSWWNVKHLSNIKFIHYNSLQKDLSANMREIAEFLEIEIDEENFNYLVENCTYYKMRNKQNPLGVTANKFLKDTKQFFYKGQNKRWENVLSDKDIESYRNVARIYMDDEAIEWMETGLK